jgi:hypothetical protein
VAKRFQSNLQIEKENRENNLSTLINMSEFLKSNRIPNLKREKAQVQWLYQINIKLAAFIKAQKFTDIFFWRFEDE